MSATRTVDSARQAAYEALRRVDHDDAYLNLVLPDLLDRRQLSARDAAFATELAYGTSRWRGSYDAVLDDRVRHGVDSLQPPVHIALLIGCHQLLSMRVASHAAVATTVDLVRAVAGEPPVRLANAVLRSVAERDLDDWMTTVAPTYQTDPIGHLSVVHSHPRWIVDAYRAVLPDLEDVRRVLVANNTPSHVTLVVRPHLADLADVAELPGSRGRLSPYAWRLSSGRPAAIPLVEQGRVGVQDEGSQLAALALAETAPSGRWLDLCAGPGGKAALLTGLSATSGSHLVAVERQQHRARLVAAALHPYSSRPAVVVADSKVPPWAGRRWDAVLADVPCTGLGALRRRPELRWRRRATDLDTLVPLQHSLLDAALDSVVADGVVAYVTCSPHAAETVGVLEGALAGRHDVEALDTAQALARVTGKDMFGRGPYVQLWPHIHDTDAMFIALLRRS
jgi:16S rRNA (cytosine967-C5)-methyltransferase